MSAARHAYLCTFAGERVEEKPPHGTRCDLGVSSGKGRCAKPAAGYARYPWGGAALCTKHIDEECAS